MHLLNNQSPEKHHLFLGSIGDLGEAETSLKELV